MTRRLSWSFGDDFRSETHLNDGDSRAISGTQTEGDTNILEMIDGRWSGKNTALHKRLMAQTEINSFTKSEKYLIRD
jgi:hypothetical protein